MNQSDAFSTSKSNVHVNVESRRAKAWKQTAAVAPIIFSAFAFAWCTPPAANAGDITKGNEVFSANCVGCHRGGQNFVKEQKTLQKDALEKYVGLDTDKVTKFFKNSFVHKVVGGKLTDEEVNDVVSYVVDQAVGEKW
ncbi:hypothetical protein ACHAWO_008178 [Cyclotella atomus]|uniref:Cytochrome c domain-containing protein n=1 Tax=Cyclotella atomus TaxID=382360 RepID=A0ABD3N7I9_9STRA